MVALGIVVLGLVQVPPRESEVLEVLRKVMGQVRKTDLKQVFRTRVGVFSPSLAVSFRVFFCKLITCTPQIRNVYMNNVHSVGAWKHFSWFSPFLNNIVEIRTLTLNVVFSSAHLTVTSVMHIDPNVGTSQGYWRTVHVWPWGKKTGSFLFKFRKIISTFQRISYIVLSIFSQHKCQNTSQIFKFRIFFWILLGYLCCTARVN
jgi:hypothetical protein